MAEKIWVAIDTKTNRPLLALRDKEELVEWACTNARDATWGSCPYIDEMVDYNKEKDE